MVLCLDCLKSKCQNRNSEVLVVGVWNLLSGREKTQFLVVSFAPTQVFQTEGFFTRGQIGE